MTTTRVDRRFRTDLPVFVSTVLDGREAFIVDVSQQGLRLRGLDKVQRAHACGSSKCQGDTVVRNSALGQAGRDGGRAARYAAPRRAPRGDLEAVPGECDAFGAARTPRVQTGFGKKKSG